MQFLRSTGQRLASPNPVAWRFVRPTANNNRHVWTPNKATLHGRFVSNNRMSLSAFQNALLRNPLMTLKPKFLPSRTILHSQMGALSHMSSFGGGPQRPAGGNRWAQGVGVVGAASVLLGKTKYVLAALKLTKLASLGSMLVTVGTYSMFFGLPYAVGMVGLITVHEAGHAIVMHQRGIPFSPMVFIPFMGAAIVTKQMPRDAWEDAVVGYGGPALGSLGAGAVAVAAHMTDSQLLYALADFGFMINLFNLLPIGSM